MYLLPIVTLAAPNEASGIVTNVVDGDTFDIRIDQTDQRVLYIIERVRLADVNSPEMYTTEGALARDFSTAILLDKKVWLDIDDRSEDGRDPYEMLLCVVYLTGLDGQPILTPSFNRILVDSGYAEMDDFTNNEFTPDSWWSSSIAFAETTSKVTIPTSLGPTTVTSSTIKKFVGSTKSDKYHYPSCRWAKKIKTENEIWFSSSEDARAHGYVPCGTCHPP